MRLASGFFLILALLAAAPVPAAETQANAIFLVARRGMVDRNFREAVVLVTLPQQGAPIGVIINRPLEQPLSEAIPDHPTLKGRKETLYFGGPVSRQGLVFLVRSAKPPENVVLLLRDVFFTSDIEMIERLLKRKDPLHREIARGDWHIVPADSDTVFRKDTSGIWPELIERATTRHTKADGRITDGGRMAEGAVRSRPSVVSSFDYAQDRRQSSVDF
jgi:putative AlgH/UPF0301 family transcriptional regulator